MPVCQTGCLFVRPIVHFSHEDQGCQLPGAVSEGCTADGGHGRLTSPRAVRLCAAALDRPSQSLKHSGKWAAVAGSTWQPPQPCPAAPTVTPMPLLIRCHMQLLAIREVWQGHPSGHEDPQRWGHPDPRPGWAVVLNGSSCLDICHLCGAQAVLSRRLSHSRKARGKQFCRSALV